MLKTVSSFSGGGGGSGTVTSVAASVPSFLSIAGSPITTSGTLAISYSGVALPIANGGTGQTTFTAGYLLYGNGTSGLSSSANMTFDGTKLTLANDASIAGVTVGRGAGSVVTNTAFGNGALASTTTDSTTTAIGYQALNLQSGAGIAYNTSVGYQNLASNLTGFYNTSVGALALKLATGSQNVAVGTYAMTATTSGNQSASFGYRSLYSNTTGALNVSMGYLSLYSNLSGSQCVGIGANSLYSNTASNNNTAIGFNALYAVTGASNTALGYNAGKTGTNDLTTGSNNILIGASAQASAATVSNEITIGNSSNTVIRYPHSYGTVASLPSASTVGRGSRTFVTDALAPTFQATVTGGGAVFTPVYSDGTNWKIG
jgi:hypothetical protein